MTRVLVEPPQLVIDFDRSEAGVLGSLAAQVVAVLTDGDPDPALERLLPDGYRGDADAAAEFSRWTRDDLVTGKTDNLGLLVAATGSTSVESTETRVRLDADEADRWTRALTDIRVTLAQRLGIETDDDAVPDGEAGAVYDWLGALQEMLVGALDDLDAHRGPVAD